MKTYGILAYPAAHSKSPQMHNAAFQHCSIDATFERYEIPPAELNTFFDQNFKQNQKISGLAVSVPHKERVIEFLDETDEAAKKIGAVNTIYCTGGANSRLQGANTDWIGFSRALREHYDVAGQKVLVLGAGGAARAVVYALLQDNADQIIIANRTESKARELAAYFHVQWKNIEDIYPQEYSLVINTTSLGMKGEHEGKSPLPADFWRAHLQAFDLVYTPRETQFLQDAQAAGAQAYSGEKMLLYQGMEQFTLWTGQEAPERVMWEALQGEL